MDREIPTKKIEIKHLKAIKIFLNFLTHLQPNEQIQYIDTLSDIHLNYISEVALNFLHGTIDIDSKHLIELKKLRSELYILSSKKKSKSFKKKLLKTIKGVNIIQILLPLALNTIINL